MLNQLTLIIKTLSVWTIYFYDCLLHIKNLFIITNFFHKADQISKMKTSKEITDSEVYLLQSAEQLKFRVGGGDREGPWGLKNYQGVTCCCVWLHFYGYFFNMYCKPSLFLPCPPPPPCVYQCSFSAGNCGWHENRMIRWNFLFFFRKIIFTFTMDPYPLLSYLSASMWMNWLLLLSQHNVPGR